MLFADYAHKVKLTDTKLPLDDLRPVLFGLFGEVGSIMSIAKKVRREEEAYTGYEQAVVEEFGDAMWYLAALCRRLAVSLDAVFSAVLTKGQYTCAVTATDSSDWPVAITQRTDVTPEFYSTLLNLGDATAALLELRLDSLNAKELLCDFA